MYGTDITFCLFPLGVGDADVEVYGEAPLLLTARASSKPEAILSSPLVVGVSGGPALSGTVAGVEGRSATQDADQRHVTYAPSPPSGAPHPPQHAAPGEGVVHLKAAVASGSSTAVSMHYVVANHLSDIQHGIVLARRAAARSLPSVAAATARSSGAAGLLEPSAGYVECCEGMRCYYACPIEDGRYAAAVMLPAAVWRRLGGGGDGAVFANWLVQTALRSSAVPADRFLAGDSAAACAAHVPLHARLARNPYEVQRRMESQVRLLAKAVANGAAQPRTFAERETALRRMCREEPSPLRTLPCLWRRMEELLRAATSSTDAASLRGVMPTMGLPRTDTRYALTASAVWYRGTPLYGNTGSSIGAACRPAHAAELLRSAALSAVLEELKYAADAAAAGARSVGGVEYASADDVTTRLLAVCLLTRAPYENEGSLGAGTRVSGYVSLPMRITSAAESLAHPSSATSTAAPPLVSLAFTSASGWTVAVLLRGMRAPFLGSPLSSIFSGVQLLIEEHFESLSFVSLVSEATAAMRTAWRRPVTLISPLAAELEAAICDIRVGRRGPAAGEPTRTCDVLLYHFNHRAAAAAAAAAAARRAVVGASSSSSPSTFLSCASLCRRDAHNAAASTLYPRCALGEGEAFGLDGPQTVHGGGAAVEAVLQAAMRYSQLAARVQRCCRGAGAKSGRLGVRGPFASSLYAQRRCRAVHSVLRSKDVTRVVQAMPHCTSSVGGATGRAAQYGVTYVVVLIEAKAPVPAHDEYRAFTSWLLCKYL
ncbi:hypothetical protein LSCM1_05045 [Leishmania martiniquensis]|uniref:Uncharacterized protein n=1 Tax=Leishmania martiniquensis TaxID=1580590 RepID=A0A836G9B2_9TRYP|nr:hypothetical protein LSCM1_05045 [Leishmania martiniquensis]